MLTGSYQFELNDAHKASIRAAKAPVHLNLARCMMKQCRYRDAINEAKKAIAVTEGDAEMHFVIKANWIAGMAFFELQELEEAEKVFAGILSDDNENCEAKLMLRKIMLARNASKAQQRVAWGGKLGGRVVRQGSAEKPNIDHSANTWLTQGSFLYKKFTPMYLSAIAFLLVASGAIWITYNPAFSQRRDAASHAAK